MALILAEWQQPDGTPITGAQAEHWASVFLRYLEYEPQPLWMEPKRRKRSERPTAERLRRFVGLETDWERR